MKLNGWQRIGVVLSVIWLVVGSLKYWQEANDSAMDGYQAMLTVCQNYSVEENRQACFERAESTYLKSREIKPVEYLIVLVPLAFAWILGWIGVRSIRWIRAGFAKG